MKTLHLSLIICGIISAGIIMYFVLNSHPEFTTDKKFYENTGLPDYTIGIVFNASSRDTPLYLKQGQNATVIAQITSNPSNLPASLNVSSHVGFTKTNGIDSKLSDTKITTPRQVTIDISATKDATPNTYKVTFHANNTLMTMYSDFYVKVIPLNEIRTVIVNDSRILGPCEIFRIPCPNNSTFTAQLVGSDTYIEKMIGNEVDHYAVVRPDRYCVYPPGYDGAETCRSQDDLTLLRLIGVDTSIPQENISIAITGLNSTYPIGKPIDFGMEINGFGHCDTIHVLIIHEGNIVWQRTPWESCPSGMHEISQRYNIAELGGPLYLNESGTYTVHVDYSSNMTERRFNITSLDNTQTREISTLENEAGIVTFGNQLYYFETPKYTDDAYFHPVQITFYDVVFTLFPPGFRGGLPTSCGETYYWTNASFHDYTSELLHIFAGPHCPVPLLPIFLSEHTTPQAGLTFYDGKMKLLVSTSVINSSGK